MYSATTGTFLQRDPLGQLGNTDLMYSHEYVTSEMRNRANDIQPDQELTNLYAYVSNNPINLVDPAGLHGHGVPQRPQLGPPMVCGFYVWLYTGSGCVSPDVYQASLDAAAGVVNCWWDCEVTTHKCVGGKILTIVEAVSWPVAIPGERIKKWPDPIPNPADPYSSVARWLAARFGQRAKGSGATAVGRAAKAIGRSRVTKLAKVGVVVTAVIEAGVSAVCGYNCNK